MYELRFFWLQISEVYQSWLTMFKDQGAHDAIQGQNVELGKPRIRKWKAMRHQGCWSLVLTHRGHIGSSWLVCFNLQTTFLWFSPHRVSSQLLRMCPWFQPCTTNQPEREADCLAWTMRWLLTHPAMPRASGT